MDALAIAGRAQANPQRRPVPHTRGSMSGIHPGARLEDGPPLRGVDRDGRGPYRIVLRCTCELYPQHQH